MKEKVLLVGKLNPAIRNIHIMMKEHFDVQLCSGDMAVVDGMFKLLRPRLVLVSLMDYVGQAQEVLEMLKKKYSYIVVVVIGSEEEISCCTDFIDSERHTVLKRPMSINDIIKACYTALGLSEKYEECGAKKAADDDKYILMVDDSAIQIRAVKAWLEKKYRVHSVLSGDQALASVKERKPDLILLDYEMPVCNGQQVLKKLRDNKDTCDIPVIFLTAVSDRKHITEVLGLKPAGYLLKPVAKERMFDVIEKVFKKEDNDIE